MQKRKVMSVLKSLSLKRHKEGKVKARSLKKINYCF